MKITPLKDVMPSYEFSSSLRREMEVRTLVALEGQTEALGRIADALEAGTTTTNTTVINCVDQTEPAPLETEAETTGFHPTPTPPHLGGVWDPLSRGLQSHPPFTVNPVGSNSAPHVINAATTPPRDTYYCDTPSCEHYCGEGCDGNCQCPCSCHDPEGVDGPKKQDPRWLFSIEDDTDPGAAVLVKMIDTETGKIRIIFRGQPKDCQLLWLQVTK